MEVGIKKLQLLSYREVMEGTLTEIACNAVPPIGMSAAQNLKHRQCAEVAGGCLR